MKNKSTIYAQNSDGIYKILHIETREDDSLHVYFPRKNGFIVKSTKNIDLLGVKSKKITFESNVDQPTYNPYFSYHPGKSVIHFNAKNKNGQKIPLVTDRKCDNISDLIKNQQFCPLITVLVPYKMDYFDKIESLRKHHLMIKIPQKPIALALEILIHGKGGYVDKESLPLARQRQMAFMCQLNDSLVNNLSYTLVFNNVEIGSKDISPEIIAFAWNHETPIGVCLIAPTA